MQEITVIGLMSGTSLDGIDAAAIRTNGVEVLEVGPALTLPYDDAIRDRIRAAINTQSVADDPHLERDLTILHSEAVMQLDEQYDVRADLIGFHGQTLGHRPDEGFTWQIGDGRLLADLTGIDVVNDFRSADMRAGGQGAPLVPVYHQALALHLPKPLAFVNIGGVANVTWVGANDELLAFDVGAGNALINDVMKAHYDVEFDEDGKLARQGNVQVKLLEKLLQHEFFAKQPPKSLDRNEFANGNISSLVAGLAVEDQLATLTQFTAEGILQAQAHFLQPVEHLYICGGGRHNQFLMQLLGSQAVSVDEMGLDGDAMEAQAFAFLAARVLYELPISFPTTTGCEFSPIGNAAQLHKAS